MSNMGASVAAAALSIKFRQIQSGVALRLPPHSKEHCDACTVESHFVYY
jgi:hypothetical protein